MIIASLNLSLCDENKRVGAILLLMKHLEVGDCVKEACGGCTIHVVFSEGEQGGGSRMVDKAVGDVGGVRGIPVRLVRVVYV